MAPAIQNRLLGAADDGEQADDRDARVRARGRAILLGDAAAQGVHHHEGGDAAGQLRDVRDSYAEHMTAWIEYVDAVSGSPASAGGQSGEAGDLLQEINDSGDLFVDAVESLPQDLPSGLLDRAEQIVDRGFRSDEDTGDLV